jgi:hypothetical protein
MLLASLWMLDSAVEHGFVQLNWLGVANRPALSPVELRMAIQLCRSR